MSGNSRYSSDVLLRSFLNPTIKSISDSDPQCSLSFFSFYKGMKMALEYCTFLFFKNKMSMNRNIPLKIVLQWLKLLYSIVFFADND